MLLKERIFCSTFGLVGTRAEGNSIVYVLLF